MLKHYSAKLNVYTNFNYLENAFFRQFCLFIFRLSLVLAEVLVLIFELVTHLDDGCLYLLFIQLQNLKFASLRIDACKQTSIIQKGHFNHEHGFAESVLGSLVNNLSFIIFWYLWYLLKTVFLMIQFDRYIPKMLSHFGNKHIKLIFRIRYFPRLYYGRQETHTLILPHRTFVRLRYLFWYARNLVLLLDFDWRHGWMVELVGVALINRVVVFLASFASLFGIFHVEVILVQTYVWFEITFQIFSTLALLGFFFLYLLQRLWLLLLSICWLFVFLGLVFGLANWLGGIIQVGQTRVIVCFRHLAVVSHFLCSWRPTVWWFSWCQELFCLQVEIEV